jgi:hypothetical protein
MRWWRRRRADVGTFEPPAPVPPATLEELVDDGLLIARAAARMAVKNDVIVRAVRDRADYRPELAREVARDELRRLAVESRLDAARVAETLEVAAERPGRSSHQSDYRTGDVEPLRRRRDALRALADRLARLSADEAFLDELVDSARRQGWEEIGESIVDRTATAWAPASRLPRATRDARMALVVEDLERLAEERPAE